MSLPVELITVAAFSFGETADELTACLTALTGAGVVNPLVLKCEGSRAILRNEALAECRTPFIAFVDGDVIVEPDWLEVLAGAWASAGPRTATIGGPILTRAHPDSPSWLTDDLAGVLCPGTPREPSGQIRAADITMYAGNLSFRADALRGAGGFWPIRGAGSLRDPYSEEHHAQWELSRAGWLAHLEPRLEATRSFGRDAGLRGAIGLQVVAGARDAHLGGNGGFRERKATIRAAASTLGAAARLDRRGAFDGMARTARLAGTLAPERLGAPTLEPTTASTQFRHSIPVGTRQRSDRKRESSEPAILAYHRVTDEPSPAGLAVTTEEFRRQLEERLEAGPAVSLPEAATGNGKPGAFAVTFDDGYADNLHVALPILEEMGVSATFFITTGHVMSGEHFWWDQVARLTDPNEDFGYRGVLTLGEGAQARAWAPESDDELLATRRHIAAWMQVVTPEVARQLVADLTAWAGPGIQRDHPSERPLTPRELEQLAGSPLATVGAHTRTHINLAFCPPERLPSELAGSREDLRELCGAGAETLAYPFGIWGADVNEGTVAAAADAGFSIAVLNQSPPFRNTLALGRIPVS